MPFYKKDGDELLVAQNFVYNSEFELRSETHADHTYPVDGWYWFDTLDAAMAGMPKNVSSVTMRQARLALLGAGLLDDVDAAINAMPEPQRTVARINWDYSSTVERDSEVLVALAASLGLAESDLDNLFTTAASL